MSTESIESNVREVDAAMASVISEVTRLHGDGVHLPVLRRRLDESVTSIQKLVSEINGALSPDAPSAEDVSAALHARIAELEARIAQMPTAPVIGDVPVGSTGVTPEQAAEAEFAAGKALAESGQESLPDLLEGNGETPASEADRESKNDGEPPSY